MQVAQHAGADSTVYIIDRDISAREMLASMIRRQGWNVAAFGSAAPFLAHPKAMAPSCLILDMSLPGSGDPEFQSAVYREQPDMPIIFFTGDPGVPRTVRAMKAGAFDFLLKAAGYDELATSIGNALDWSDAAIRRSKQHRGLQEAYRSLTKREGQVMCHVVSGASNKEIAWELGITIITVKAHRGKVMRKMSAGSVAELVKIDSILRGAFPRSADGIQVGLRERKPDLSLILASRHQPLAG
jgi:FixJ family two-component response regulator